jgi:hypothetical protein
LPCRAPSDCASGYARWHTGDDALAGSQTGNEDHGGPRSEDERESEFRSDNSAPRSLANPDDRARRHPAPVDIAEQADQRGRPDANLRETKKTPRWLRQNREVLGYNAERLEHILVLLTRRQRIEGKGEDFFCSGTEKSATGSGNRSMHHRLAKLISLPSRFTFAVAYLGRATWKEKLTALKGAKKTSRLLPFQAVDRFT